MNNKLVVSILAPLGTFLLLLMVYLVCKNHNLKLQLEKTKGYLKSVTKQYADLTDLQAIFSKNETKYEEFLKSAKDMLTKHNEQNNKTISDFKKSLEVLVESDGSLKEYSYSESKVIGEVTVGELMTDFDDNYSDISDFKGEIECFSGEKPNITLSDYNNKEIIEKFTKLVNETVAKCQKSKKAQKRELAKLEEEINEFYSIYIMDVDSPKDVIEVLNCGKSDLKVICTICTDVEIEKGQESELSYSAS